MGSLAVPPLSIPAAMPPTQDPSIPTLGVTSPPEIDSTAYRIEVLRLTTERTEDELDRNLLAKAAALGIELEGSRPSSAGQPIAGSNDSAATHPTNHARSASSESHDSTSTGMTSTHSIARLPQMAAPQDASGSLMAKRRAKSLSFSQYEKYISQVDPNLSQPKFHSSPAARHERSFSAGSRTSITTLKRGLTTRLKWRKRTPSSPEVTISCICCRDDFHKTHHTLQTLPCGHTYCQSCVAVMVNQSTTDESKMPPRCCTQPIPASIIKAVLGREEQHGFLKAVLQYSTPWEARIFCPNVACAEFIPPRAKIDPKHPFEAVCRHCRTRVCVMCKRNAHRLGLDCPDDWELDAVLKMGERSGWRRCYKCRTLVELTQGCTHMTCRCKAQFCYICGAVWEPVVGCPNFCNGEEELERRRAEEEARAAERQAEKDARDAEQAVEQAARLEADARTAASAEFRVMAAEQRGDLRRFRAYERRARAAMAQRLARQRRALTERYADLTDKMRERHAKTEQHLEDRQIEAEMDLRASLDQSERSIRIRLKYMEAYCNGPGAGGVVDIEGGEEKGGEDGGATRPPAPRREVTARHLEELGQQYHVRDGMERRHQSQINVLREKQAKRMEELVERHGRELEALAAKRDEDVEDLAVAITNEEEALARAVEDRKGRMLRRWELAAEILRRELEGRSGLRYGAAQLPRWEGEVSSFEESDENGDEQGDENEEETEEETEEREAPVVILT